MLGVRRHGFLLGESLLSLMLLTTLLCPLVQQNHHEWCQLQTATATCENAKKDGLGLMMNGQPTKRQASLLAEIILELAVTCGHSQIKNLNLL